MTDKHTRVRLYVQEIWNDIKIETIIKVSYGKQNNNTGIINHYYMLVW